VAAELLAKGRSLAGGGPTLDCLIVRA